MHACPSRGGSHSLFLAMLCASLIAGCSLFRGAPPPKPPEPVKAAPPPKPELPRPVATHQFQIDPDSGDVIGYLQRTSVGPDDTLPDIARRFDIGYEEMLLANPGVDPWLPGVGREVIVPTQFVLPAAPREGVVVNVAAMRIFYFPPRKKGEPQQVYTYPIGIGRVGWKTPEGTTKIISREKNPVWVVPKSVREEHAADGEKLPDKVPAGPNNPLGQYAFHLEWPSYLIHGTNKPYGVGMRSSHGCMRLYPEDIAVMFDQVPVGTKVTVVNQPYVFGSRDHVLYLQAYAVMEDDSRDWNKNRKRLLNQMLSPKLRKRVAESNNEIDWQLVGDLARKPRGVPVPVSGQSAGLDAALAQARPVQDVLPKGSNWDGKSELLIDENTYQSLLGDRNKPAPASPTRLTSQ